MQLNDEVEATKNVLTSRNHNLENEPYAQTSNFNFTEENEGSHEVFIRRQRRVR
jgi:hypothetical protein